VIPVNQTTLVGGKQTRLLSLRLHKVIASFSWKYSALRRCDAIVLSSSYAQDSWLSSRTQSSIALQSAKVLSKYRSDKNQISTELFLGYWHGEWHQLKFVATLWLFFLRSWNLWSRYCPWPNLPARWVAHLLTCAGERPMAQSVE